jgi:hypothetical protein
MKKTLLIAALTLTSVSAFASKARVMSLGMAKSTASDVQQVFEQPHKMWEVGDLATIEFGGTGTSYDATGASTDIARGGNNAEGGFLRSHNNTKWGAYIGHQSDSLLYMLAGGSVGVATTAGEGLRRLENPVNLWYGIKAGDLEYGFNLFYAASETKSGADMTKKSAMGVSAGVRADRWNADLVVGLGAKLEDTNTGSDEEFKGTTSVRLQGEYAVNDDLLTYGSLTNFGGKHTTAANVENLDLDHMALELGVESKIKSDVVHFFYGAALQNRTEKNKVTGAAVEKVEQMLLPLYFGFEADAASWLVLRASLKQNFLLNSTKVSTAASSEANDIDSTVASLGAGFKFGKLVVDGVLSTGTSGNLNFNDGTSTVATSSGNFMSLVSATYMF